MSSDDSDLDLNNLEDVSDLSDLNDTNPKPENISSDDSSSDEKDLKGPDLEEADFGDVFARVLNKNVSTEKPILQGKRKLTNEVDKERVKRRKILEKARLKKLMMNKERVEAPQFDPTEKRLLRVATKGVVTLFNAISTRQREDAEEKKRTETQAREAREERRSKLVETSSMSNRGFLDLLKKQASTGTEQASATETQNQTVSGEKNAWNILTDSYMMKGQGVSEYDNPLESSEEEERELEELENETD